MKKTLKGDGKYYALICDDAEFVEPGAEVVNQMICGVYASYKEAEDCAIAVKDCPCKHYIVECAVTITYNSHVIK